MINFKLNGKLLQIPSCWEDVSFKQYLDLMEMQDNIYFLLSVFTGIEESVWRDPKTLVSGLDQVIEALTFLQEPPNFSEYTGKIGPYALPKDILLESPAQFEDMRQVRMRKPESDREVTARFAHYVAIYLQKIRDGEYDNVKAEAMIPEISNYKASEVVSTGAFFFIKLSNLKKTTTRTSLKHPTKLKKFRSDLTAFIRSLARRLPLTGSPAK